MLRQYCLCFFLLLVAQMMLAQPLSYAFQTITTSEGLSSGNVNVIAQDKYGYIWLGNSDGLNRYNGYEVQTFEHQRGDSTSVLPSVVRHIFSDSEGRLWVSFLHGLMEYDFEKNQFRQYGAGKIFWVGPVVEISAGQLLMATSEGLVQLDTKSGHLKFYREEPNPDNYLSRHIWDIQKYGNQLYLIADSFLVLFDLKTQKTTKIDLPDCLNGLRINRIRVAKDGTVWLTVRGTTNRIYRTDLSFKNCRAYTDLDYSPDGLPNTIVNIFLDKRQRLWASTYRSGIAAYDPKSDSFRPITNNPWLPNSLPGDHATCTFEDRNGFIWVGLSGIGAAYFHPEYNLFQTLLPGMDKGSEGSLWARDAVETPDGQLWLATGSGLYQYNLKTNEYRSFQNRKGQAPMLYDNSVRALCLDHENRLWIGTSTGLNCYHLSTGRMDFLTEKDGFPTTVYLGIKQDSRGTIWFGGYQDGHYYLLPGEKKARNINQHPTLQPYANLFGHCILEDSRNMLWLGLDGRGLICYDPARDTVRYWERTQENDSTLLGNFINSITEDSKGNIWVGTSGGLSSIEWPTFHFTNYDHTRGLPANWATSVLADRQNRLWVGTSQGLLLLDSSRQRLRLFNRHDGLPTDEFSNMPASKLRDGRFVFPTRRGFLFFNPEKYRSGETDLPLLLSSVRVFNQPFSTGVNCEELKELHLPPGQNFFTLEMTALNYRNPHQTWYAYRMEPYDQQWTYTHDRMANYTNVPPGKYVFHYKATTDPNNWDNAEQTLRITVEEYWYLSRWFWGAIGLVALSLGGWFLLRRIRYRRALFQLERKAQALAKEKAQVQYENLTQQLNPHFLFNSLASLGSLIRFEPAQASSFLAALSKMYRYMLQSPDKEVVTLEEELDFAANFIHLQHTRFGDALQITFNIEEGLKKQKIVPVTLQNLLENALKHNTLDLDDPLHLEIFTKDGYLLVRNNIQRRKIVETSNKQGLEKLRSLYQYLTKKPILIEEKNGFFTVRIPLLPAHL